MNFCKTIHLIRNSFIGLLLLSNVLLFADGGLDPSFGTGGEVLTAIPGNITGVYVQADGNIVGVASGPANNDFQVVRLTTTGALDGTFGSAGVAAVSLGALATLVFANGIAVQSDGKIVVVGTASGGTIGADSRIFVARLTTTGSLDATFNSAGVIPGIQVFSAFQVGSADQGNAVVVNLDGKIVVAGSSSVVGGSELMAVGQLTATGALDLTFNGSGQQVIAFNAGTQISIANAVALLADGRTIVVAGKTDNAAGAGGTTIFAYAKVSTTGVIGAQNTPFFDPANPQATTATCNSVLVQPDGSIILIGSVEDSARPGVLTGQYFALAKYTAADTLDATFGAAPILPVVSFNPGTIISPTNSPGPDETSVPAAGGLQSDGKIIAAGTGPEIGAELPSYMFARYLPNGDLDTTFNGGGAPAGFVYSFTISSSAQSAMALQGDGDIVGAGYSFNFGAKMAFVRLLVSTPLQATTITTPVNGSAFSAGPISFTGLAQNPSIVDFFLDGTQIQADSTATIGTSNAWSIPGVAVGPGIHTAQVVGRYRDDGHVNLAAQVTFEICNVTVGATSVRDCVNGNVTGNLLPLVSGGTGPYTFTGNGAPVGGTVTISPSGIYTFTGNAGFSGLGDFGYLVTDPFGCTAAGVVDVLVASPVAANAVEPTICVGGSVTGDVAGLVTDGFPPYIFGPTGAAVGGSVTINPSGIFSFTAATGFIGTGSFVYQATDANSCVGTGLVSIPINSPIAGNTAVTTCTNTLAGNLALLVTGGVGGNFFEGPIGPISCSGASVTITSTGLYNFTAPNTGFTGPCSFVYEVTDANDCVATGVVTVTSNLTPIANNLILNTCFDTSLIGNLVNSVTGGTPPLTFAQVGSAVNGTVVLNPNGSFTFSPNAGFLGVASFQYQVTDSSMPACTSNVATVTINVINCCPPGPTGGFFQLLQTEIPYTGPRP